MYTGTCAVNLLKHIWKENGNNPHYLQGVTLRKKRLSISTDINEVVDKVDVLILCIPAAFLADSLANIKGDINNTNSLSLQ